MKLKTDCEDLGSQERLPQLDGHSPVPTAK